MTQDINDGRLDAWIGQDAYDADGSKVGKVADLYYDTDSGQLEWLAVTTGLFGSKVSFVPIAGSRQGDDGLVLGHDKATVKDAPRVDPDGQLTQEEEQALYRHYGVDSATSAARDDRTDGDDDDRPTATPPMPMAGASTATGDRTGDDGDDDDRTSTGSNPSGVTSSTGEQVTGGFRLRRYLVTESRQITVPVTHEEVRLEREDGTPVDEEELRDGR